MGARRRRTAAASAVDQPMCCCGMENALEEEGKTDGFIHPGAGTDNIHSLKLFAGDIEHTLELRPFADVGLLKDGSGRRARGGVGVNDFFGFRAESEVGKQHVTLVAQEKARESEVDAWASVSYCLVL